MAIARKQSYTLADIYTLPDGQRAELIGDEIYMMSPPSTRHQRLVSMLHATIYNYINTNNGKCEVIPSPFSVFIKDENDKECYVEPDISVICDADKIDDKGCHGAPDWIIEIVSPSSRKMDYGRKQALYLSSGVQEYWIVDPLKERVVIYRQSEDWTPIFVNFSESVKVGIYPDLEITVK